MMSVISFSTGAGNSTRTPISTGLAWVCNPSVSASFFIQPEPERPGAAITKRLLIISPPASFTPVIWPSCASRFLTGHSVRISIFSAIAPWRRSNTTGQFSVPICRMREGISSRSGDQATGKYCMAHRPVRINTHPAQRQYTSSHGVHHPEACL